MGEWGCWGEGIMRKEVIEWEDREVRVDVVRRD